MTDPNALRILLQHDFRSFLEFAYGIAYPDEPFIEARHLDVIADALVARPPGSGARLVLNAPPRTLKSFSVSVVWPLFLLARHRGLQVSVVAGTQELAAELTEVRERLLRSPRILSVFPNLRFRRTTGGLVFDSGGRLTQSFVGRSQIGRGSDVIVIDDPLQPVHADDEARRSAVQGWFAKEVAPRLNSRGAVVVLAMQRLHPDDLSGHLLAKGSAWDSLAFAAIAKADTIYRMAGGRFRTHRKGEALCPERASVADHRAKLTEIGGRNFLAQYLQAPSRHSADRYPRTMLTPMVPLPGFEHLPRPPFGLYSVSVTLDVLIDYFGEPDPFDTTGFREETREEFERETIEEQARMIAEMEADIARMGL